MAPPVAHRAASSRICSAARSTSRRRTPCCRAGPRRPALPRQRRDRPADGGDRGPAHAYHLVPGGASKAKARRLPHARPRLRARGVHRRRRLDGGPRDGRGRRALLRRRQRPRARPRRCARRSPVDNVTVTEGRRATASTRPSSRPWPSAREIASRRRQSAGQLLERLDDVHVRVAGGALDADLAGSVAREVGVEAPRGDLGRLIAGRGCVSSGWRNPRSPAKPQQVAEGGTKTSWASAAARARSRRSDQDGGSRRSDGPRPTRSARGSSCGTSRSVAQGMASMTSSRP